jgi:hypothetical protein
MFSDKPGRMPTAGRQVPMILIFSAAFGIFLFVAISGAHADRFAEQKQQSIERCQAIDEKAYSTGMIFNPKGQVTMFERSRCFQDLAVAERDPSLCDKVVERKSWFFDGSAISEKSCRERVAQKVEKDRQDFASKDFSLLHRLRSVDFARNGNGKDFDFELATQGAMSGAYELELVLAPAGGGDDISIIHDTANRFGSENARKIILLRRSLLAEKLGDTFRQTEWTATVTLQFAKTAFNRFHYDAIPRAFRSSRLEAGLRFADLPRWQPEPIK